MSDLRSKISATFGHVIQSIAIIGNGKVGRYLLAQLRQNGWSVQAYARRPGLQEKPLDALKPGEHDLLLLAVSDDALAPVAQALAVSNSLVAHVSGATPLEALAPHARRAIWYPLMSLKPDLGLPIGRIPFCLEAAQGADLEALEDFTHRLKATPYRVDSRQRPYLHLAAVFAHNFSNHLYHLAYQILQQQNLPWPLLHPLLQQATQQLSAADPAQRQTGPAVRQDQQTLERHRALLDDPQLKELYNRLTEHIIRTHEKEL
ncbi:MAG: DUF2520 domain-containing protein [Schleiferiaceae bacterium]|nr:DUF2520 domain-containing protein [Schleiferiaceae bacterium]